MKKFGEPRPYKDAPALRRACEAYFSRCDQEGALYGEAGLALALGVTLRTLRDWYDGKTCEDLQNETQRAYLRIQDQIETGPAYTGKSGMSTRAVFLLKQARLGGYQDRPEARQDAAVNVRMSGGVDEEDFR